MDYLPKQFKNAPFITFADDVNQLCQPLFEQINTSYLGYLRLFHDGSISILTNNTAIQEDFIIKKTPFPNINSQGSFLKRGFYLTHEMPALLSNRFSQDSLEKLMLSFLSQRQQFQLDHGLVVVKEHKDYDELFFMNAYANAKNVYSYYLNNKENIESFCSDFSVNAERMIARADQHKLILPKFEPISLETQPNYRNSSIKLINSYGNVTLVTLKQYACLHWLARGRTIKMIAKIFNCSPRTVETHLNTLKIKLKCQTRLELIEIYEMNYNCFFKQNTLFDILH